MLRNSDQNWLDVMSKIARKEYRLGAFDILKKPNARIEEIEEKQLENHQEKSDAAALEVHTMEQVEEEPVLKEHELA